VRALQVRELKVFGALTPWKSRAASSVTGSVDPKGRKGEQLKWDGTMGEEIVNYACAVISAQSR